MGTIVGIIAGALLVALAIPQLVAIVRTRDTAGVNPAMWWLVATCSVLWAGYAWQTTATPLLVANLLSLLPLLAVASLITASHTHRPLAGIATIAASAGVAGFMTAAFLTPTPIIAAAAITVSVISALPQLVTTLRAYHHRKHTAVSLTSMTVLAVMQILWIVYGIAMNDPIITATNAICLTSTLTIITVTTLSRTRTPVTA